MIFGKTNNSEVVSLKYKPIPMTPALMERKYEEENRKRYGIVKKHKFFTE